MSLTKSTNCYVSNENTLKGNIQKGNIQKKINKSVQNFKSEEPKINKKREYRSIVKKLVKINKTLGSNWLNTRKNRYPDVLPIEETRVKLLDLNNDYINANHITYNNLKYISTQAPVKNTFRDFWKMVWDQKSPVIMMLTDLSENNVVKADCYWDINQMAYDSYETPNLNKIPIKISITRIVELDVGLLRILNLTYGESSRSIYHIQYTDWGDHKEPASINDIKLLIGYIDIFKCRGITKGLYGPPIIHCSAGIGRTGTFISCAVIKSLVYIKNINIKDIVTTIRKCREGMVQTTKQYNFIFDFQQSF